MDAPSPPLDRNSMAKPIEIIAASSASSSSGYSSDDSSLPRPSNFQREIISTSRARIFPCRWDWCSDTFSTNSLLIDHVIQEHVRKAVPVRRRDLNMLRRTEDGEGMSSILTLEMNAQTSKLPNSFTSCSYPARHKEFQILSLSYLQTVAFNNYNHL